MSRVWAVLRILGVLALVLMFVKNMQPVTGHFYLGYSLTLPFFLWLILFGALGLALGYITAWFRFHGGKSTKKIADSSNSADGFAAEVSSDEKWRVSSPSEAFKAVPAAPKGEDEHRHYGI